MTSIKYIAYIDKEKMLGVINKVIYTCQASKDFGYCAEEIIIDSSRRYSRLEVIKSLWRLKADIVILRNPFFEEVIFFPLLVVLRIRGMKIIIDMPTPVVNVYQETKSRADLNYIGCLMRCALLVISYPWFHLVANRIVTYSNENAYFQLGLRRRTVLTGNAINLNSIRVVEKKIYKENELNLIGVAALANWHGYDRLIRSLGDYYRDASNPVRVSFTIVGDGVVGNTLRSLVKACEVEGYVEFAGFKSGEDLDQLYAEADVAVGSLGMHRIGLTLGSTLKVREYAARGKPFLLGYDDVDIEDSERFAMKIAADESAFSVIDIICWYRELQKNKHLDQCIRSYAELRFDFKTKIHLILDGLDK